MRRFVLEMLACAALASGLSWADAQRSRPIDTTTLSMASPLHAWLVDPYGRVDGALLRNGRAVFFDPDRSTAALHAMRIADPLRVEVRGGVPHLVSERNSASIALTPAARGGGPEASRPLEPITARGNIAAFVNRPDGSLSAIILETGEQARVDHAVSGRLTALRLHQTVTLRGRGTVGDYGTGLFVTHVEDVHGHTLL